MLKTAFLFVLILKLCRNKLIANVIITIDFLHIQIEAQKAPGDASGGLKVHRGTTQTYFMAYRLLGQEFVTLSSHPGICSKHEEKQVSRRNKGDRDPDRLGKERKI